MKTYRVSIVYEEYSTIDVQAESPEEATRTVENMMGDYDFTDMLENCDGDYRLAEYDPFEVDVNGNKVYR